MRRYICIAIAIGACVMGVSCPDSASAVETAQGADAIRLFDKDAFIASASYTTELRIAMVDCVGWALTRNSDILVKKISPLIEEANVLT